MYGTIVKEILSRRAESPLSDSVRSLFTYETVTHKCCYSYLTSSIMSVSDTSQDYLIGYFCDSLFNNKLSNQVKIHVFKNIFIEHEMLLGGLDLVMVQSKMTVSPTRNSYLFYAVNTDLN